MLKNHLKIAIRHLVKNRSYSLLNIAGLSDGIASCMIILQYVRQESSFDKFHQNGDQVYRVILNSYNEGNLILASATNFIAVGPSLKQDYPEVEEFARLVWRQGVITHQNFEGREESFNEEKIYFADPCWMEESLF